MIRFFYHLIGSEEQLFSGAYLVFYQMNLCVTAIASLESLRSETMIFRLGSMPALIFYKPQTFDCIGFSELLAFGAGKGPVHIGRITQRLRRVAMHRGDVITVADHVVHHRVLCISYSSARPPIQFTLRCGV